MDTLQRRRVLVTFATVALVIAAVLYTTWPLAALLGLDASTPDSLVSELAARDQPWSWLFRLGDTSAGVVAVVAGIAAAVSVRDVVSRVGYVLLAVFGAATVADASMPLACAPSVTPGCPTPSSDLPHVITSGTSSAVVCCGIVLVLYAARTRVAKPAIVTGFALAAIAIGGLLVFSVRTLADNYVAAGAIQRGALLALSLGLAGSGLLVRPLSR
ncbi:DUF998 domain-containing protein [Tenggerimyces flavus]|uniref:DUF998 domain-containing protein n=1 Tax=Tenggerimyces flavus TaxID=1708749 RepID=A0ABV7YK58_9ACTN|nr:DUF998 domain-containing protein [Tenggerimyces flavus]MBM7787734.1 hypothetical protein [Tenggerimyces flavus]